MFEYGKSAAVPFLKIVKNKMATVNVKAICSQEKIALIHS